MLESQKISIKRDLSYEIALGSEVLPLLVGKIARLGFTKRAIILTNDVVSRWYLEPLVRELEHRGFTATTVIVPDGESYKSLETAQQTYPKLIEAGVDRSSPIITLGGGVIGDLGGFLAATYMRGIPFVQLPTTLLAMVDASIGGKVAVNLPAGKNLIGSFYQPSFVGIDVSTLKTLPLTQISYGIVEAIKHGAICDPAYYKFIYKNRAAIKNRDLLLVQRLVRRSLHLKKNVVEQDEQDQGLRHTLNFGHTFGHALETLGEYRRYHHGEAVGIGMLLALKAAKALHRLQEDYSESLRELLLDFNLPVDPPREWGPEQFTKAIAHDKKALKDKIKFVLPLALGKVEVVSVPAADVPGLFEQILG
ncbi:MAG TPA: 3-dehydroquinate synthase [Candidatus Ozemobacteraceae bacterium]|nr:3-dehydroquinate synthase [Candidatus Ozemobacteraceae bacterium]